MEKFAREDPKICRHLDVVRRKELLENVLREIDSLQALEAREKRYAADRRASHDASGRKGRGWGGLF